MDGIKETTEDQPRDLYAEWKRVESGHARLTALGVVDALLVAAWFYSGSLLPLVFGIALSLAYIAWSIKHQDSAASLFQDANDRKRNDLTNRMISNMIAVGLIDEDTTQEQIGISAVEIDPPTFEITMTQQGRTANHVQTELEKMVPVFAANRMTFRRIDNCSYLVSYPFQEIYEERSFSWSDYGRQ